VRQRDTGVVRGVTKPVPPAHPAPHGRSCASGWSPWCRASQLRRWCRPALASSVDPVRGGDWASATANARGPGRRWSPLRRRSRRRRRRTAPSGAGDGPPRCRPLPMRPAAGRRTRRRRALWPRGTVSSRRRNGTELSMVRSRHSRRGPSDDGASRAAPMGETVGGVGRRPDSTPSALIIDLSSTGAGGQRPHRIHLGRVVGDPGGPLGPAEDQEQLHGHPPMAGWGRNPVAGRRADRCRRRGQGRRHRRTGDGVLFSVAGMWTGLGRSTAALQASSAGGHRVRPLGPAWHAARAGLRTRGCAAATADTATEMSSTADSPRGEVAGSGATRWTAEPLDDADPSPVARPRTTGQERWREPGARWSGPAAAHRAGTAEPAGRPTWSTRSVIRWKAREAYDGEIVLDPERRSTGHEHGTEGRQAEEARR
jgi:hypothetical protein